MWTSLLQLCYLMSVRPFICQINNRVEITSEMCVYLSTYLMFLFCNVALDEGTRMLMGWQYIAIVSIAILINLGVSTVQSIKDLMRACRKKKLNLQSFKSNFDKSLENIKKFLEIKEMSLDEAEWLG